MQNREEWPLQITVAVNDVKSSIRSPYRHTANVKTHWLRSAHRYPETHPTPPLAISKHKSPLNFFFFCSTHFHPFLLQLGRYLSYIQHATLSSHIFCNYVLVIRVLKGVQNPPLNQILSVQCKCCIYLIYNAIFSRSDLWPCILMITISPGIKSEFMRKSVRFWPSVTSKIRKETPYGLSVHSEILFSLRVQFCL